MSFHNQLIDPTILPDTAKRVPFHTLQEGDRYSIRQGGWVSTVIERKEGFATVRRWDDWLVPSRVGDFVWDREVVKVFK